MRAPTEDELAGLLALVLGKYCPDSTAILTTSEVRAARPGALTLEVDAEGSMVVKAPSC